jgi:hypothetical protein
VVLLDGAPGCAGYVGLKRSQAIGDRNGDGYGKKKAKAHCDDPGVRQVLRWRLLQL